MLRAVLLSLLIVSSSGCALIHKVYEPRFHNPFPQLTRVAVLPFFNQSTDPTVNQVDFALAYANELQNIPGFEVMPVGVVERALAARKLKLDGGTDFQKLARELNVDAVVVGAVTDFSEYYPPRLGLAVNWYAANPGFHPIPPGYGLPWGTADEEYIPDDLVRDAEFALAREQLKTQTPDFAAQEGQAKEPADRSHTALAAGEADGSSNKLRDSAGESANRSALDPAATTGPGHTLPPDWPDPRGFIPPAPCAARPELVPQASPIIEHVRRYDGHDADFTAKLASYYFFRDDARFGGWQSYLQRKSDFIRFCCYLHVTETLAARGGSGETRVVRRVPGGRYEK